MTITATADKRKLEKCTKCLEWKAPSEFNPKRAECKSCRNKLANARKLNKYARNAEYRAKTLESSKAWQRANREKKYIYDQVIPLRKHIPKCIGDSTTLQKYGVCIHIDCPYHLADCYPKYFNNSTDIYTVVAFLTAVMPVTCAYAYLSNGRGGMTYEDIAPVFGVSKQRVEQICTKVVEKLGNKRVMKEMYASGN